MTACTFTMLGKNHGLPSPNQDWKPVLRSALMVRTNSSWGYSRRCPPELRWLVDRIPELAFAGLPAGSLSLCSPSERFSDTCLKDLR